MRRRPAGSHNKATLPETPGGDPDWRDDAECQEHDPELFFPLGKGDVRIPEALAVCAGCRVRATCLDWALAMGLGYGIWGGVTEWDRNSAARRYGRGRAAEAARARLAMRA